MLEQRRGSYRQAASWLALATAIAVSVGSGWAVAATTTSNGAIQACAAKKGGALRLARNCKKKERPVSWSEQGPTGEQGSAGAQGIQGVPGSPGAKGDTGAQGPGAVSLFFQQSTVGIVKLAEVAGFAIDGTCSPGPVAHLEVAALGSWTYNYFGQNALDDGTPQSQSEGGAAIVDNRFSLDQPTLPESAHFTRFSGEILVAAAGKTRVAITFTMITDARSLHPACSIIGQAVPSS
jgi:hypothetical protein